MSPNPSLAEDIVHLITEDLKGRKGLGDEWDQIEPSIRREICATWAEIVRGVLDRMEEE